MKYLNQLLTVFLLLASIQSDAIHIKGGWMYYEYLGTNSSNGYNNYKIVVKVFRDCATPSNGQNDAAINLTFFRRSNNQALPVESVSRTRIYRLEKKSFSECINPKPTVCYVVLEYEGTVSLPPDASGYVVAFQRCCRINDIVNIQPPSNTYGNTYTITIPGTVDDANKNSSPIFVEKDTVAVCYNSEVLLDYSAADPDGDSLTYEFTSAYTGGSTNEPVPTVATAPPFNGIPYKSGYTDSNPFGTNVTINRSTGIITGKSPATTGEYVLAVLVKEYRNGQYLAETRKELHVNVAPCTLAAAALPLRQVTCDGYTVSFENLSPSPSVYSYYWDFGVSSITTDTSTAATPTYTYPDTGVFKAKLVVNPKTACTDSATTEVRVFPGFFPDFKYTGSCFANPFQFTDISTTRYGVINSYLWNFGVTNIESDTSIQKNPQYSYPLLPGSYTVVLKAASDKGCEDTVSKQIEVLDKPALQVGFKDTLICSIDSLRLNAIGTGTFSWSPVNRMIRDNTASPTVFPNKSTTYTVTLNDRGCVASDTVRVNVLDFITADAGPDTTICLTDGVTLSAVTQGLIFSWSPAATLSNSTSKSTFATPTAASTTYTLVVNLGKCSATDNVTVRTVPYPVAAAGKDTAICFGENAFLAGTSSGGTATWSPASLVSFPDRLSTPAFPRSTTSFVLTVVENNGCPKPRTDTVLVSVVPRVQVFAGNDTTIVIGQPLLMNSSSNASTFLWTPSTGLSDNTILKPVAILDRNSLSAGEESIRYVLKATTAEGCTASDDIVVRLFKTVPSIFVPNAFTPNQDGRNDVIRPILAGMKRLIYFRVFNRYGQLVFETRQQNRGWDGTINGVPQAGNAYVYTCEAEDYTGKTVRSDGTFVLVK